MLNGCAMNRGHKTDNGRSKLDLIRSVALALERDVNLCQATGNSDHSAIRLSVLVGGKFSMVTFNFKGGKFSKIIWGKGNSRGTNLSETCRLFKNAIGKIS